MPDLFVPVADSVMTMVLRRFRAGAPVGAPSVVMPGSVFLCLANWCAFAERSDAEDEEEDLDEDDEDDEDFDDDDLDDEDFLDDEDDEDLDDDEDDEERSDVDEISIDDHRS